ncbi:MAG: hypothetical protein ACLQBX_08670 [Candidatus Limnocylindrales bacterium]
MNSSSWSSRTAGNVAAIGPVRRAALLSALLAVVTLAACSSSPTPSPTAQAPTPSPATSASTSSLATSAPTPSVALARVTVTGVGAIRRGGSSPDTLAFSFIEAGASAFGRGPGSFDVTILDHAGSDLTLRFTGTPSAAKSPGSLGATATIIADVLTIRILDSDPYHVEPIIVTGIGIAASPTAAIGPIFATMGSFTGSLAGGATNDVVASPAVVTAGP